MKAGSWRISTGWTLPVLLSLALSSCFSPQEKLKAPLSEPASTGQSSGSPATGIDPGSLALSGGAGNGIAYTGTNLSPYGSESLLLDPVEGYGCNDQGISQIGFTTVLKPDASGYPSDQSRSLLVQQQNCKRPASPGRVEPDGFSSLPFPSEGIGVMGDGGRLVTVQDALYIVIRPDVFGNSLALKRWPVAYCGFLDSSPGVGSSAFEIHLGREAGTGRIGATIYVVDSKGKTTGEMLSKSVMIFWADRLEPRTHASGIDFLSNQLALRIALSGEAQATFVAGEGSYQLTGRCSLGAERRLAPSP